MKTGKTLTLCVAMVCATYMASAVLNMQSSGPPNWINYQGRLTGPSGAPLPDGPKTVVFRIFGSAIGGPELWWDTEVVAVRGGIYSAKLGKDAPDPFPADLFTNGPLWLETTVDGKTLTPRQEMGAVPFAMSVAHVPASALPSGAIVPVGSVISWYGNSASIPSGWKLCDGSTISDPASPLNGRSSPSLSGKFIRGTTGDVTTTLPSGGSDTQTLTQAQMPVHAHGVNDPGHSHKAYHNLAQSGATAIYAIANEGINSPFQTVHGTVPSTTGISINNAGGGQSFSTVPSYVGLVFIMRVK